MPPQFRGSGKTLYRHSLRVWNLPDFSLASEFITGGHACMCLGCAALLACLFAHLGRAEVLPSLASEFITGERGMRVHVHM